MARPIALLRVAALLLAALAVVALGSCDSDPSIAALDASRRVERRPIGPLPGSPEPPARRNPYRDDATAIADGRRFFVAFNCYGCHGGRAGGGMGPSLRDRDWLYGASDEDIFDSIADGRAHGMPAFGSMLPEETIWKLTSYVTSLRTAREPERPQ
jgi:cytochrome c oxidase cbb3-type subunit 3